MAGVLKLAELSQGQCVTEVNVGGCRIDAELDTKRPTLSQLSLE
jgi:hypothetical protein